jgi:hypothetical protein
MHGVTRESVRCPVVLKEATDRKLTSYSDSQIWGWRPRKRHVEEKFFGEVSMARRPGPRKLPIKGGEASCQPASVKGGESFTSRKPAGSKSGNSFGKRKRGPDQRSKTRWLTSEFWYFRMPLSERR